MRVRAWMDPSTTTGFSLIAPTARMVAAGGLMTAVNSSIPYIPRFETVKVAPWYSSGASFFSRARAISSRLSSAI